MLLKCWLLCHILAIYFTDQIVGFQILRKFENFDNIPAPMRYTRTNTTTEATYPTSKKIPYRSILEYFRVLTDRQYSFILAGKRNSCPSDIHDSANVDMTAPGKVKDFKFTLKEPTKFQVLQTPPGEKAKVLFHSTYDANYETVSPDNHTEWSDIIIAVNEGNIFNATFRGAVNPDKVTTCPTTEYYPVPSDWCDHSTVLYQDRVIKTTLTNNQLNYNCAILFTDQVKHYVDLWKQKEGPLTVFAKCVKLEIKNLDYATQYVGTEYETMYPQFFFCHKQYGENSRGDGCYDDLVNKIGFKSNGVGEVISLVAGRSDNANSIDFNFTVEFDQWTGDFTESFSNTFRDCGYITPQTYLEMSMYIKDIIIVPVRGPPGWIFPFAIIAVIPIVIMISAVFCLCMFCSKKGFDLRLWKFYKLKKRLEKKEGQTQKQEEKEKNAKDKQASFDNSAYEE